MNGLIWHEKKLIYFFIPKNACTSLKKVWADGQGLEYRNPHIANFDKCNPANASKYGYTAFAVVRNPLARLVSLYKDKLRPGFRGWGFTEGVESTVLAHYGIFKASMPFKAFAAAIFGLGPKDPHWAPQFGQISNKGKVTPEVIIKYENFNNEINELFKEYGIEAELPHLNKTKSIKHYLEYYDKETIEAAKLFYKKDIELWYPELLRL